MSPTEWKGLKRGKRRSVLLRSVLTMGKKLVWVHWSLGWGLSFNFCSLQLVNYDQSTVLYLAIMWTAPTLYTDLKYSLLFCWGQPSLDEGRYTKYTPFNLPETWNMWVWKLLATEDWSRWHQSDTWWAGVSNSVVAYVDLQSWRQIPKFKKRINFYRSH